MAAAVATMGLGYAREQADAFLEDPLAYFIRIARKVGVGLLAGGTCMGIAGYYLQAAATGAANNELNIVGNIGTIFSNIKAPTFQAAPSGTAPLSWSLQGVQNFFGDAWTDVQAAGSDIAQIGAAMGTLGEDVAMGLVDLAKAALAFIIHFPDILWNGLVWGIGSPIAAILNWVFPWLLIIGGGLVIASMIAQGLRALWKSTVGAAWSEAWAEKSAQLKAGAKARFRRLLRVHGSGTGEGEAAKSTPVNGPPPAIPAPAMTPLGPSAESPSPPAPPPDTSRTETEPEAPEVGTLPAVAPYEPGADEAPEEGTIPAGWTREEMEDYLGKAREGERDEAKASASAAAPEVPSSA